jgi:hypothetical protein
MSIGWNRTAAKGVQRSDKASSLPVLDVPGWLENRDLVNRRFVCPRAKL